MKKIIVLFVFIFIGFASEIFSQVAVSASIDSVSMLIGEQSKLSIKAIQPSDHMLQFPTFSDTIVTGLEIVSRPKSDTINQDDGSISVTNNYIVTSFDSALIYMPGFNIVDGADTFTTNPLSIKIIDVVVDTTKQQIADIKDIYEPPFDWRTFWIIFISVVSGLIIIAIISYLIYRYIYKNRLRPKSEQIEYIDPRKAHEIAIEELAVLREKKLWQNNHFKEYYTVLTDIVRQYIFRRYSIGAMEQTSDELLAEFKNQEMVKDKKEEIKLLTDLLQIADLVKFAKYIPLPPDCERSMTQAEQFVQQTKQEDDVLETKSSEKK